jgi:hypothetical protein
MNSFLIYPLNGVPRDDHYENPNPGLRLAQHFETAHNLRLLDCSMKTSGILFELVKFYRIFCTQKPTIWFYNLPLQYWLIYLLYVIVVKKRPNIIVADGVNVFLFKRYLHFLVNLFFTKKVWLSFVTNTKTTQWYPGHIYLPSDVEKPNKNHFFLYNSKALTYNGPKELLQLIVECGDTAFHITSASTDYFKSTLLDTKNVTFHAALDYKEYCNLIRHCRGVILIRDISFIENAYNFPSKLLEALSLGAEVYSKYPVFNLPVDRIESLGNTEFMVYGEKTKQFLNEQNFEENLKNFLLQ